MTNDHRGATTTAPLIVPCAVCQIAGRLRGGSEGFHPSISAEPSGQVSTYDFLVRARGVVPTQRVGTLRHSPGVPTPDPDPQGVVWRGETPPFRRSRMGKEEVPPPMTRSNLDRWEDCGEAPQGTSLAQLRSNVLDFSRLKSHARGFRHGTHSEVQGSIGRAHARPL